MDFGHLFGDIGNFLGSVFGGNQKKKREDQQSQPIVINRPQAQAPQFNINGGNNSQTPDSPLAQQQAKPVAPQLGGIDNTPSPVSGITMGTWSRMAPDVQQRLIHGDQQAHQAQASVWSPGKVLNDVGNAANDFTAQANDAFLGGATRGATNIVNSLATGFNGDETKKRTNDFLHTMGQNNADGQSNLAIGSNKNSAAGQWGEALGGTEKLVADNVPYLLMPGVKAVEALPTLAKIGANAGIGGITGFGQGVANGGSLQEDLTNAGIGTLFGGGLTAAGVVAPKILRAGIDTLQAPARAAEAASGLPKVNVLNDNEAYTLGDFGDYLGKRHLTDTTDPRVIEDINKLHMQARNAADTAGIDITSGSSRDVQNRIAQYLEQRDNYQNSFDATRQQQLQGGFAKVPFGKDPASTNPNLIDPELAAARQTADQGTAYLNGDPAAAATLKKQTDQAIAGVDQQLQDYKASRLNKPSLDPTVPSDPTSAITPVQKSADAPAITSPNRPQVPEVAPESVQLPAETNAQLDSLFGKQDVPTPAPIKAADMPVEPTTPTGTKIDLPYSVEQSSKGDIYLKMQDGTVVSNVPKTIQNTLYKQSQGDRVTPDEMRKFDNFIAKNSPKEPVSATIQDKTPVSETPVTDTPADPNFTVAQGEGKTGGIPDMPKTAPQPAGELGTIARSRIEADQLKTPEDSQKLGNDVATAIEDAAKKTGTTWEDINKKVQVAYDKKLNSYQEAGLTKEQYDVALKAADELALLRNRTDPKLVTGGTIERFYSPRQTEGTDFTPELVNELSRGKTDGLKASETDLSTTPYNHAVRRYGDAQTATSNQLFDAVEKKVVKGNNGEDQIVETGAKVSDETKQAIQPDIEKFVEAKDKALKAATSGDAKAINDAVKEADKHINDALNKLAEAHPDARDALVGTRHSYEQSTIRTNMFLNVANRAYDQVAKGIVNSGDKLLPLANRISAKIINGGEANLGTGFKARSVANKYARGSLNRELGRSFKTNVALAGAGRNPLMKGIAKLDSAYRSTGTLLTSLGDTTTNAVRATNMAILGDAQAQGITSKAELEKYLVSKIGTPEYKDLYHNMSNVYAGYIGMPETITGIHPGSGKLSQTLSKIDNAVKKGLDNSAIGQKLPPRVRQELNDFIMPSVTGFAGATNRIFQKSLNAMALGIPQIKAGLKLAASDMPHSQAVGQLMISRSLIDATSAAGVGAAGLMLGSQGHWTGSYPSDANERARWEKDGVTPNSFQFDVGGKKVYVEPGRVMGALALPLVIPAVTADAIKKGTNPVEAVGQIMDGTFGQFMQNMGTDAFIKHVSDIGKLSGNEQDKKQAQKDLASMLGFSISNAVPASGLMNNVANATDPYERDTSGGIGDIIQSRNPVTRGNVPVKKDVFGNPMANNSQLSLGSSAVTFGANPQDAASKAADPLSAEIDRLAKLGSEVTPKSGSKNADTGTNQDLAKLLLGSKVYGAGSEKDKANMLKEVLAGTTLKDVSPNLSNADKSALMEHQLVGGKRNVWMENNDNAFSYISADINNRKENGTLTAKDMDLGKAGSLAQKYTIAKVNKDNNIGQDVVLGYADTSKTEFNKMADGPAKEALLAYDKALEAAGLTSKYKNSKGGYGKASGGGSGRGGVKAADKFAFASLPSSLMGTDAGTGNGSGKYASAAPLFKPIADLKAPAIPEIPKGRSISIKRGVTL